MRKAQKNEIFNCIASLRQAHEEIGTALRQGKSASVQNMLCECQQFAISIGENIEKSEGEGQVTVSYLEEYCELLYRICGQITDGDINENAVAKKLQKELIRIENSVKNDIPVRKEVAFFPYKASMWDSLESVYLKAKEDENCDAYCVPIPYYELNPDHSFGTMHYEGSEYPDNIEVTDWQTYNFEERRPDVIYIHNPYDNCNLVTSVHPLIENTLKSMRPGLLERYEKMKEKYRAEGRGIYDDTADMDRAVILSDAYYGDGSSVVQLYQKTGKPVMVQNVDVVYQS